MRLIDADDLLEQRIYTVAKGKGFPYREAYKNMLYDIEHAPTIEAAPIIKAHWEQAYNGYVCSNCHSHFTINTMGAGEFCSKCGAKMDKSIQFDLSNLKIEGE